MTKVMKSYLGNPHFLVSTQGLQTKTSKGHCSYYIRVSRFLVFFLVRVAGEWGLPQSTQFYISSIQEISLSFIHSSIHQMLVASHMIYPEEWNSTPA